VRSIVIIGLVAIGLAGCVSDDYESADLVAYLKAEKAALAEKVRHHQMTAAEANAELARQVVQAQNILNQRFAAERAADAASEAADAAQTAAYAPAPSYQCNSQSNGAGGYYTMCQ
jgi:hypothetical protein